MHVLFIICMDNLYFVTKYRHYSYTKNFAIELLERKQILLIFFTLGLELWHGLCLRMKAVVIKLCERKKSIERVTRVSLMAYSV